MTTRYVRMPAHLPEDVLKDFMIMHRDGDKQEDAWRRLVELVGRAMLAPPEKNPETSIVMIKDVFGEPALVFPDTPRKQVVLLLSHLSQHISGHPQASESIVKAVNQWRYLRSTGHLPPPGP